MTDKQKDDKGNGEPQESTVTVRFPAPGVAEVLDIQAKDATPGQVAVAAVWLLGMSLHNVFSVLAGQQAQAMKEQAMMEAIMKGVKK